MATFTRELEQLHQKILSSGSNNRYLLQPKLDRLIARIEAEGGKVPGEIHWLNEELADEAIEAQFDNMPV